MDTESPEYLLARLREREHAVAGVVRAQHSWREVLGTVYEANDADEARDLLCAQMGFSREQAVVVIDTQFRRVSRVERQRMAEEFDDLQSRIRDLENG